VDALVGGFAVRIGGGFGPLAFVFEFFQTRAFGVVDQALLLGWCVVGGVGDCVGLLLGELTIAHRLFDQRQPGDFL
jgi:hypothetical protein